MDLRELSQKYVHLNILHRYSSHLCCSGFGIHRGQPPILKYLFVHGESSQKEISDFLGVSPASVATSIKRLQKNGLVEKKSDENDLRFNKIALTKKGREIYDESVKAFDERDKQMFRGFSEKELENFSDYIDRMIENLNEEKQVSIGEMLKYIHKEDKNA